MIKSLDPYFVYVDKPRTKTCLDQVLDNAQDYTNQDSRAFKLQKGEFKFCEGLPIKNQTRPIENCKYVNSAKFKSSPSPRKHLEFLSNTTRYKKKTIITFQKLLEDL